MDKHIKMHTSAISLEFLSEETKKLKEDLEKSEAQLRRFQDKYDIISLPEQQNLLLDRIENIDTAIQQTEADISATKAAIEKMKPNIEMRAQVAQSEVQLESMYARLNVLRQQKEEAIKNLDDLRKNEQEYLFLQRKVEMKDENYRRYLASLEQARISQTLESQRISNVSIMQKPTYIMDPISQEKSKTAALGLFLGVVLSIGLAFFIEYLNHKVKTVDDIKKALSLKTISTLPFIKVKKVEKELKRRERKELKKLSLPPKKLSKNVTMWLYIIQDVRESFENIKTLLYQTIKNSTKTDAKSPYILAVTSSYRGEGVSSVATGIAYTIALQESENVLLVDSNLHHLDEERIIGINRPAGLYEISVKKEFLDIDKDEGDKKIFSNGKMKDYLSKMEGADKVDHLLPSVQKLNYKILIYHLLAKV